MNRKTYLRCVILSFGLLNALLGIAQKKVLDHSVYDAWKSISNINVSNDGKYSAIVVKEQEGDDYLLVKNLQTQKQLIVPRAYSFSITPDQKHIIAQIKAPFAVIRQAKIKKTAEEKMPKDSLAIISLDKFSVFKIPNVKNYKLGKDYSGYVGYIHDDSIKVKDKKDIKASTLILRNLLSGKEDTIKHVTEYAFSRNGKSFAYVLKPGAKDTVGKSGVGLIDLNNLNKKIVSVNQKIYKNLSLSESGSKLTFLATADSLKKEIKDYSLFYFDNTKDSAFVVADKGTSGMPEKWNVSENYNPSFSKDEKRLFLGTAPIALPKDTTIPDFEKAQLDIWHWQEPLIQPQQLVQLNRKLKETFLSYIDLTNGNRFYQLATEDIPEVRLSDEKNGRFALGLSDLEYRLETQWDYSANIQNDIWAFDLFNNTKRPIKTGLKGTLMLSPQGDYLAWYNAEDKQYYSYSMKTGKEVCLTDRLNINFWDEKNDTPSVPGPYGYAAWMENDEALLVYDAYDIWKLDPNGVKAPENITKNTGRDKKVRLRYIKTDPESIFIKPNEKLLLSAFDETTKETGYYELAKGTTKPLVMGKYTYSLPVKAKDKDIYCFTKGNFNTFPDLYVTSDSWKTDTRLSDVNPQMKDYNWGTAELMSWTTFDGKPTQGIVYKPENFDANKKYPVMIYFYEKHTDNLYQYFAPAPSRSIINIPFYCSRGYIVFTPDIQYTTGHPGESAYNSIVSGAQELAKNAWVDKDNMAIQGQSWGGYQTAYLVTRTDMFKAAGAGAPVSNMFSAYGGIRWESGMSRQFQYEQTQSRIGATMWEAPELYKENSPIFFVEKVQTPLLIMHNDNDGAVPWYQGIEYFMALRRLGKPVWMLQYNNEAHNLKERKNCKDLSIRLQQFFDHYLKGDPMPVWMKTGVPATEKGKTYGFELE